MISLNVNVLGCFVVVVKSYEFCLVRTDIA